MSSIKKNSVQVIKYFYLMNLFTITNILLYFCPVIGSFNFSNFTIKSHNITFYGLFICLVAIGGTGVGNDCKGIKVTVQAYYNR